MKRWLGILLVILMTLSAGAAFGESDAVVQASNHHIVVQVYTVGIYSTDDGLKYYEPEYATKIAVECQSSIGHTETSHKIYLREFYPTKVGLSTEKWAGYKFASSFSTSGVGKFTQTTTKKITANYNFTTNMANEKMYLVYYAPTPVPTEVPTIAPTEAPTITPTEAPTIAPTEAPTIAPTEAPTITPTEAPTKAPVADDVPKMGDATWHGGKMLLASAVLCVATAVVLKKKSIK